MLIQHWDYFSLMDFNEFDLDILKKKIFCPTVLTPSALKESWETIQGFVIYNHGSFKFCTRPNNPISSSSYTVAMDLP